MEMTKMLLPAVPSMGNHIHSNDKFDRRLYRNYHNLKEFRFRERIFLSQLKELETGNFLEVVRESLIENFDLLHIPYYESQRITRPSANEEYRYDFTTTPNEKKTEIQSNLRSKPEPQPEPKPQLEPKPNPEPEIEPKSKPETKIKSEPESELDYFAINWRQEIGLFVDDVLKQDLDLILKNGYDSDDGMITISEICKLYDSDDEFAKRTFPNDTNSKPTSMPIREQVKRCKEKRKDVFMKQEDGGNTMWPILGPIKPCLSVNYQRMMPYDVQHRRYNTQTTLTRNLANRSLLKSQCNVNNTFSPTKWRNPLLTSNNPEKKLYDQNQDYQRKIVMPYIQQAIDSQDAEIKQLLSPSSSDDDLMETDTEVDEMPVFQHDHFNVNKLNEYLSEGASTSRGLPKNEEPAQRAKRHWRKTEENQRQIEDNIMRNTLSDHCYHLNQPRSMGRLELSDSSSDEEIDVVSYERQMTQQNDPETTQQNVAQMLQQNIPQAMQPNIPQATQQNVPQTRRNTTSRANQDANENNTPPARRPRGRPPGPNSAKRRKTGQTNRTSDPGPSTSSSSRVQNRHQRAERRQNSMSSGQNRNDNEKSQRRRLHNNMERMRRNSLKNKLDLVHKSIPAIKNNMKASKLVVLLHAREYILSMQEAESNLKYEKARLKMYNDRLVQRLNYLKRMSSLSRKH